MSGPSVPLYKLEVKVDRQSKFAQRSIIYDGTAHSIIPFLRHELSGVASEHTALTLLDVNLKVIGFSVLAVGSLTSVSGGLREAATIALNSFAHGVIFIHTHPHGGQVMPSPADRETNKIAEQTFSAIGLEVQDTIIISAQGHGYFSFREERGRKLRAEHRQKRQKACDVAKARIVLGKGRPRDVLLLAADEITEINSLGTKEEKIKTLNRLLLPLEEIAETPRRVRRRTRERAKLLLSFVHEILPDVAAGEFISEEKIARAVAVDYPEPQRKQAGLPIADFV